MANRQKPVRPILEKCGLDPPTESRLNSLVQPQSPPESDVQTMFHEEIDSYGEKRSKILYTRPEQPIALMNARYYHRAESPLNFIVSKAAPV